MPPPTMVALCSQNSSRTGSSNASSRPGTTTNSSGLAQSVLMFAFLWWMYAGYSWLTNVLPPTRPMRRLLLLGAMTGWLLIGLSVPTAFSEGGPWIAVGVLIVVLIHGLMYLQTARTFGSVFAANLAAVACVFVAQLGPEGLWRYGWWAGAAVIVWSVPFLHGQRGLTLHPGHISERHGLVVIIALGESFIATALSSRGIPVDEDLLLAAVLGLAIVSCQWWMLFTRDLPGTETALLTESDPVQRIRKVLRGLSYSFIPILLGLIVFVAGLKHAVGYATAPLELESAMLTSGGVAAFVLGTAGLRASMGMPGVKTRTALAVPVLALIPLGLVNAAIQLAAITAVLVAALVAEGRYGRDENPVPDSGLEPSVKPSDPASRPSVKPSESRAA